MAVAEKEHKKIKKMMETQNTSKQNNKATTKEEPLPLWFEKNIEKQKISTEEQKEFDDLINNF